MTCREQEEEMICANLLSLHQQCEFHRTVSLIGVKSPRGVCDLCPRVCMYSCICALVFVPQPPLCVCLRLVTLEPVVLSSDPDPRHLSAQITHTHTHTQLLWPFPGVETQSQLPTMQNLPAQQGFVFFLWVCVCVWLERPTVCCKMNWSNFTPYGHIQTIKITSHTAGLVGSN